MHAGSSLKEHAESQDVALLREMWSVVTDIEAALTADTPDPAKLSAIAHYITERLPGGAGAHLPRGSTCDDVAGIIAAEFARGALPAIRVFAGLMRCPVAFRSVGPHLRAAGEAEARALRVLPGTEIYVREGVLEAGSIICAHTSLKLSPENVIMLAGGTAWGRIRSGEPVSTVLGRLAKPGRRTAEVLPGGNPAVKTRRVLLIRTYPACVVTEEVSDDLCARLAAAAAR
jgi:hypothetical protein